MKSSGTLQKEFKGRLKPCKCEDLVLELDKAIVASR